MLSVSRQSDYCGNLGGIAKYGKDFKVKAKDCEFVRVLDSQRPKKKAIYGGGFFISDRLARKKLKLKTTTHSKAAKLQVWELSDREKDIISKLG